MSPTQAYAPLSISQCSAFVVVLQVCQMCEDQQGQEAHDHGGGPKNTDNPQFWGRGL